MVRRRDHTSGGDALAATGERSATRAIAPRPGVGQGGVLSGRPETPAFVRSVASLMTSGCGTISIYTSDTRGALVNGRSRRADGFCSGLRRSVNASRTPCASCGTSAITRCVGCRIVRMWWPGPWEQSSEIRLAPTRPGHDNDASSAIGRLPGADPLAQCGPEVL